MRARRDLGVDFYGAALEVLLDLMLDRFGSDLVSFVLYGSVARGQARPESDIDLLVVLENPPENYHRRIDMVLDVQQVLADRAEWKGTPLSGMGMRSCEARAPQGFQRQPARHISCPVRANGC